MGFGRQVPSSSRQITPAPLKWGRGRSCHCLGHPGLSLPLFHGPKKKCDRRGDRFQRWNDVCGPHVSPFCRETSFGAKRLSSALNLCFLCSAFVLSVGVRGRFPPEAMPTWVLTSSLTTSSVPCCVQAGVKCKRKWEKARALFYIVFNRMFFCTFFLT